MSSRVLQFVFVIAWLTEFVLFISFAYTAIKGHAEWSLISAGLVFSLFLPYGFKSKPIKSKSVVLLSEDAEDIAISEARRNEPSIPFDEVVAKINPPADPRAPSNPSE